MVPHSSFRQLSLSVLYILSAAPGFAPVSASLFPSLHREVDTAVDRVGDHGSGVGDHHGLENVTERIAPVVRKMSSDPGEMFFYHYWGFSELQNNLEPAAEDAIAQPLPAKDMVSHPNFHPAVLQHADFLQSSSSRWTPRALVRRDFTCPADTNSCEGIDRPNSCCPPGLTCHQIKDTGLGDVGCCPDSSNCSGDIAACPADYTACPQSLGGGCCIPGYACNGVGCVKTSTKVVVVGGTTITGSASAPAPPASSASNTCSNGFLTCAASFGGGCCPPDADCTSSQRCVSRTGAAAPIRGTSDGPASAPAPATTTTTSSAPSSPSPAVTSQIHTGGPCPSNFYPCSAFFPGAGCCQVGRDCASTSCPARTTASRVVSNGVTILVEPTVSNPAFQQGNCAGGWLTCDASVGGGCCPGNYRCGTASCTAQGTASGAPDLPKENVARKGLEASRLALGMAMAMALCILC